MRLLVIEDNAELGQLLAKGLIDAGFQVDSAATAEDARSALMTTRYSSIVLDLGLPDEDGMSILQEIRGKKDPVPVLILTARSAASRGKNSCRSPTCWRRRMRDRVVIGSC